MNHVTELMIQAMLEASELYPMLPGLIYRSPFDFVALHGKEYTPCPFYGQRRPARICFGNAIIDAALYGYTYVEGFAMSGEGNVMLHAWTVKRNGELYDSTWCNRGCAYYGVEFSVERADDAIWNGDDCILNDEQRGYPIFRAPWPGEDYSLTWPRSDRLEMLRSGELYVPESMEELF